MNGERGINIGSIVRYFKGGFYEVVAFAENPITREKLVIYRSLGKPDKVCALPAYLFFGNIDRLKYPGVTENYIFELIMKGIEK